MKTQPFLRSFVSPAALCAFGFLAAMAAVLQYSVRAFVPGSLEPGGFTLANFTALLRPLFARVFVDTVWICFLTTVFTLIVGYPLAYALVHVRNRFAKSFMLITVITPLFLGEVVRTYAWIIVLGSNGFINSVLLKLGLIAQPVQFMFTTFGVVLALVHVTIPVMVVILAAALSHIDRNYVRAAESLGAGPIRAFVTVTLPLSMPGISGRGDHLFCVDVQRLRHAAADRRRPGQYDLKSRLSARLRQLQLSVRGKPLRRRTGACSGRPFAAARRAASTGTDGAALTCRALRFNGFCGLAGR